MPWDESRFPVQRGDPIGDVGFLRQFSGAIAERGGPEIQIQRGDGIVDFIRQCQEAVVFIADRVGRWADPSRIPLDGRLYIEPSNPFSNVVTISRSNRPGGLFDLLGYGHPEDRDLGINSTLGFQRRRREGTHEVTLRGSGSNLGYLSNGDTLGHWLFNELRSAIDLLVYQHMTTSGLTGDSQSFSNDGGLQPTFGAAVSEWQASESMATAGLGIIRTEVLADQSGDGHRVRSTGYRARYRISPMPIPAISGQSVDVSVYAVSQTSRRSPFESITIYDSSEAATAGAPENVAVLVDSQNLTTTPNEQNAWGGYVTDVYGVERPSLTLQPPPGQTGTIGSFTFLVAVADLRGVLDFQS